MNKKILQTTVMLSILVFASFASVCAVKINSYDDKSEEPTVDIRIALYTNEEESDPEFYSIYKRTCYFIYALDDYTWQVGNTTYSFKIDFMNSNELFSGELTKEEYDVFLYTPIKADYESKPSKVKENLFPFIKDGGGYLGICASAMMMANMTNEPETSWEKTWKNRELGISCTNIEIKGGTPFYNQLFGNKPEDLGPTAVYTWVSGFNSTDYYINHHCGVCLDMIVNKNHPLFQGYKSDTRRIRWLGSPPLVVPDFVNREISVLAEFPQEEISDNESTRVHYWEYTGGLIGMIKAIFKSGTVQWNWGRGLKQKLMLFSGDWEKTNKIVETDFAGKAGMTAEIYPNENQARIVLSPVHPEYNVWWDGHMIEPDTDHNNIYEGLNRWTDITPMEETPEDEFSFNYWLIRRSIAWASQKVPDSDLPTVYGASEICDFKENMSSSNFTVYGNCKTEKIPVTIGLYYRYSNDDENWSEWALFDTDNDISDDCSWEFNSPNGSGYYEFYSIRTVEYEGYIETETVPPEADANVYVGND
jgi:hypothetical protein